MNKEGPLQELLIDRKEADQELLNTTLKPYVRIDPAGPEVVPTSAWPGLEQPKRLLIYLLARKAMFALSLLSEEAVLPQAIQQATGIPGGTLRPLLRRLLTGDRVIAQTKKGSGYYIPTHAVEEVRAMFSQGAGG